MPSPRDAWLPTERVKQQINVTTAIKNYCSAVGDSMYLQYCKAHLTRTEKCGDRKVVSWENPDKVAAFDEPIKEYLRYLYTKYWRSLPQAEGYPREEKLNLALVPPSVPQFQIMLKAEGVIP